MTIDIPIEVIGLPLKPGFKLFLEGERYEDGSGFEPKRVIMRGPKGRARNVSVPYRVFRIPHHAFDEKQIRLITDVEKGRSAIWHREHVLYDYGWEILQKIKKHIHPSYAAEFIHWDRVYNSDLDS